MKTEVRLFVIFRLLLLFVYFLHHHPYIDLLLQFILVTDIFFYMMHVDAGL